jgi:transcriptional regulator with XRE-family HTH domain
MISPVQFSRVLSAAAACRSLGVTQSQIAEALGASQGQVSRILGGKVRRSSRLLNDVCLYVERMEQGVTGDAVRANEELISALQETWNGTSGHAKALAAVIRSTKALCSGLEKSSC